MIRVPWNGLTQRQLAFVLSALAAVSAAAYLMYTLSLGAAWGFPIDDAWIHQTFARNFAQTGQFAYNAGQPTAGSTSPLWTVLLAIGYFARIDYRLWAYALGIAALVLCGLSLSQLARQIFPDISWLGTAAAILLVLDWRLLWAALSGMEVNLYIALLTWALVEYLSRPKQVWRTGIWLGLLTLVRPDGLLLAGVIAAHYWWRSGKPRIRQVGTVLGLLALSLVPLVLWNWLVGRQPLPNTFYAKASFYGSNSMNLLLINLEAAWRYFQFSPLLLLLPFAMFSLFVKRQRRPGFWICWIWAAVFLLANLVLLGRLYPAAYQLGRYLMPLIPMLVLFGLWGMHEFFKRWPLRLLRSVTVVLLALVFGLTWVSGMITYGQTVRVNDDLYVRAAQWVAHNTPATAVVAFHDVGALGYFGNRRVLDTVGLVTPEAIPYINSPDAIMDFLKARCATHLLLFPVEKIPERSDLKVSIAYQNHEAYITALGGQDIIVYRLQWTADRPVQCPSNAAQ